MIQIYRQRIAVQINLTSTEDALVDVGIALINDLSHKRIISLPSYTAVK